jgi:hypothetical protein
VSSSGEARSGRHEPGFGGPERGRNGLIARRDPFMRPVSSPVLRGVSPGCAQPWSRWRRRCDSRVDRGRSTSRCRFRSPSGRRASGGRSSRELFFERSKGEIEEVGATIPLEREIAHEVRDATRNEQAAGLHLQGRARRVVRVELIEQNAGRADSGESSATEPCKRRAQRRNGGPPSPAGISARDLEGFRLECGRKCDKRGLHAGDERSALPSEHECQTRVALMHDDPRRTRTARPRNDDLGYRRVHPFETVGLTGRATSGRGVVARPEQCGPQSLLVRSRTGSNGGSGGKRTPYGIRTRDLHLERVAC